MSDNGNINEYAAKLSGIVSKSATLGEVMSEHKLVKKFLTSLPRWFVHRGSPIARIVTQAEEEDMVCTVEVVVELVVKDVFNRLYKAQLKVGKEDSNQASKEPQTFTVVWDERILAAKQIWNNDNSRPQQQQNTTIHTIVSVTVHATVPVGEGWKIHQLDVKKDFLHGDPKDLNSIEVSQGKDCMEIKQERYAMKILKEASMEDCNATLYPMEKDLKLSKAKDEPKVKATQYRKMVGCLCYLLHTRPDLTYSVGVDSYCSRVSSNLANGVISRSDVSDVVG
ncbi:uncharacterized mitochondrial protein-like protein [Tanacetum coccineum]